jgi:hypothetical protein
VRQQVRLDFEAKRFGYKGCRLPWWQATVARGARMCDRKEIAVARERLKSDNPHRQVNHWAIAAGELK